MRSMFFTIITTILSLILPSGFWYTSKYLISYFYLKAIELFNKKRLDYHDYHAINKPEQNGYLSNEIEYQLESPLSESQLINAEDKILCYGVSSKSEILVVSVARLCDEKAEACVYLRLANGNVYQLKNTSDYQQPNHDPKVFSCGGLQIHYERPMRRWRIFYSGFLRETSDVNPGAERMVYVKFAFLWRASSNLFDFMSDISPNLLARSLASATWNNTIPPIKKLQEILNAYAQSGIITGTVSVDNSVDEQEMYLFGERVRSLSSISVSSFDYVQYLGYVHKNGAFVHFGKLSVPNVVKDLDFGFMIQPDSDMKSITDISTVFDASNVSEIRASFYADHPYEFSGSLLAGNFKISEDISNGHVSGDRFTFHLNGYRGSGICIKGNLSSVCKEKTTAIFKKETPKGLTLVTPFADNVCQDSELTGGKGSSLGKLTSLSKQLHNFVVPNGVVVTTSAYEKFVTKDIVQKIKQLENVLYGNTEGDVKEASQKVCDKIIDTEIQESLKEAIVKTLRNVFGQNMFAKKYAIRSSATGEDTEQMSAAGQMDTFLGISGMNEILLAVKKCWASQFGYIAIEYKRRYGQILNSPMAVVIQEMIHCDVAGVMFTCDPLTGNPTVMSITANYGLGESVVSGSEEPDTIELARDFNDEINIRNKSVGAKSHKIIIKDGEGASLEEVPENERNECCLSDGMAMRLARIGIQIEKHYRSRRDIEFGFWNNNLYIFQSRPVTSGTQETDFEIENEFDSPLRVENDYTSVSNTGEVINGALSTLGQDIFYYVLSTMWQGNKQTEWQGDIPAKYFILGWTCMRLHGTFNVVDIIRNLGKKDDYFGAAMMVSLMGRVLDDPEIIEVSKDRFECSKNTDWIWTKFNRVFQPMFFAGKRLEKTKKRYQNYRIPLEGCRTSEEIFEKISQHCSDVVETVGCHIFCTLGSSLWNMRILSMLAKAKGAFDNDVYRDFSTLLKTNSHVESADVPSAIQSVAYHISKAINPEDFKKMETEKALHWLKTSSSTAGKKFNEFLSNHGHRCVKEFDVHTIPWGSDPKPLVKLLQGLVGHVSKDSKEKENESFDNLIPNLSVKLGFLEKLKLRFLLYMGQSGVQRREMSKSIWVKGLDGWRKAYCHLAKVMVSEGRIPDEDILFFMTVEEIRELLKTRSPKILAKARHRQKLHPKMDKYIFPEIMRGVPKPINTDEELVNGTEETFTMIGIPVSQGVAKGYLRVALKLEDAAHLKPGEILLAYSTDIGWSPYFPMLAGCVTELGGLISHGAVVSREYGLPCVAGLHGATRRFQTGDYVFLDGNKGELKKLAPAQNSS